jgi:hypothetical protein
LITLKAHTLNQEKQASLSNTQTNWDDIRHIINQRLTLNISFKTEEDIEAAVKFFNDRIQWAGWNGRPKHTHSYSMLFAERVLPGTMESRTDNPHLETSYRPISILPIVSKVFEKLLLKRFLQMLENNRLIPNLKFAFRQRHSTIEQTHGIVQRINGALENKQYCSAAFLDISQAFDIVWHTGLMYKLNTVSPSELFNYFLILKSYFHSRHFLVNVETEYTGLSSVYAV